MRPAALALMLLTVGACLWGSDWLVRRLLMWLIVLMVSLSSGCTYTLLPTHPPKVRLCFSAERWKCHPAYEWSEM